MYDNKEYNRVLRSWSVDETITPEDFVIHRELQNYSLANISTCIFMLNMLPIRCKKNEKQSQECILHS